MNRTQIIIERQAIQGSIIRNRRQWIAVCKSQNEAKRRKRKKERGEVYRGSGPTCKTKRPKVFIEIRFQCLNALVEFMVEFGAISGLRRGDSCCHKSERPERPLWCNYWSISPLFMGAKFCFSLLSVLRPPHSSINSSVSISIAPPTCTTLLLNNNPASMRVSGGGQRSGLFLTESERRQKARTKWHEKAFSIIIVATRETFFFRLLLHITPVSGREEGKSYELTTRIRCS